MEGKRFIHRLKLKNLLSFGPEGILLRPAVCASGRGTVHSNE